jgi:hypothetical protein
MILAGLILQTCVSFGVYVTQRYILQLLRNVIGVSPAVHKDQTNFSTYVRAEWDYVEVGQAFWNTPESESHNAAPFRITGPVRRMSD